MKLVFIYGPPAVGKLTVAKKLAALTGFKVFHNHLTFDMAEAVFPFMSPPFLKLIDGTRVLAFELAAEAGVDLIFTFCYCSAVDESWIKEVKDLVEGRGGEVLFVRLTCPQATLEERVVLPDRAEHGKLTSVDNLRETLERWDMFISVPYEGVCINTQATQPAEAARLIMEKYQL